MTGSDLISASALTVVGGRMDEEEQRDACFTKEKQNDSAMGRDAVNPDVFTSSFSKFVLDCRLETQKSQLVC